MALCVDASSAIMFRRQKGFCAGGVVPRRKQSYCTALLLYSVLLLQIRPLRFPTERGACHDAVKFFVKRKSISPLSTACLHSYGQKACAPRGPRADEVCTRVRGTFCRRLPGAPGRRPLMRDVIAPASKSQHRTGHTRGKGPGNCYCPLECDEAIRLFFSGQVKSQHSGVPCVSRLPPVSFYR